MKRIPDVYDVSDLTRAAESARARFSEGHFDEAFDIYEQVIEANPAIAVSVLAEVYDQYQRLPDADSRYQLYQSRCFTFPIQPGDKVLDIGSGHIPFPMATHLAELAVRDDSFGRAGVPFRHVEGKPVFECGVEDMPFEDGEFDFVYCSHVLEHVDSPERACQELMRVGKRGYIETPTRGKDIWLNSAGVSNHRWYVEDVLGTLIFAEYAPEELKGLQCDVLMNMHCAPQTEREKAFSALIYLKAPLVNTMFMWEGAFDFEVRRKRPW